MTLGDLLVWSIGTVLVVCLLLAIASGIWGKGDKTDKWGGEW